MIEVNADRARPKQYRHIAPLEAVPLNEPINYCCEAGVLMLKAKIEAYWRERGFAVRARVQEAGFHPAIRATRFDLRSDMRNGLPVRAAHGGGEPAPEPASRADLVPESAPVAHN